MQIKCVKPSAINFIICPASYSLIAIVKCDCFSYLLLCSWSSYAVAEAHLQLAVRQYWQNAGKNALKNVLNA
jgi:hypothetical protein